MNIAHCKLTIILRMCFYDTVNDDLNRNERNGFNRIKCVKPHPQYILNNRCQQQKYNNKKTYTHQKKVGKKRSGQNQMMETNKKNRMQLQKRKEFISFHCMHWMRVGNNHNHNNNDNHCFFYSFLVSNIVCTGIRSVPFQFVSLFFSLFLSFCSISFSYFLFFSIDNDDDVVRKLYIFSVVGMIVCLINFNSGIFHKSFHTRRDPVSTRI